MPPTDRRMVILGGHALNLLGVGVKLLALTVNHRPADALFDSFQAAQGQMLIRSLCGTLVETWSWLNREETYKHLQAHYLSSLPTEALAAYHTLGPMFSGSGVLTKTRNQFGFHFPKSKQLDQAFSATPDTQDFNWYVADENIHSLYFGCEAVIGFGVGNLAAGEVEGRAGMVRLVHEFTLAANAMADFLGGLLAEIVNRHLADRPRSTLDVSFQDAPRPEMPFLLHGVMTPRTDAPE